MQSVPTGIARLFAVRNKYGTSFRSEKHNLICFLSGQAGFTKKQVKKYFEVLLFIKVFPDDEVMFCLAEREIGRLVDLLDGKHSLAEALYDSGITNTLNRGMFSFTLAKWLRATYGKRVRLEYAEADQKKCIAVLTCIMGEVPVEILQEGYMKWEYWLIKFRKDKQHDLLDVLLEHFDAALLTPRVKDELWNDMGIVVSVMLDGKVHSLCSNVGIRASRTFHSGINKNPVIADVLKKKPREIRLNNTQKLELIALAKMVLACHQRETDPVTHGASEYCRYYDQGNGLTTVLLGLPPERRQPIDSYIGYMAFKNGVPIAYGGGWILFDSCRIGVNVFPAFRGGESSLIFAQIIGLYKHVFGLNRFTVDPYQIGKNNSEGIKSGAFWMYYRLGFRPMREHLRALAASEFNNIVALRSYRTTAGILKKLADSKPELFSGSKKKVALIDATDLSTISLNVLQNTYKGDVLQQNKEIQLLLHKIKHEGEKIFAESWMKLLGPAKWKKLFREQHVSKLIRLKSRGDEWAYVQLLQKQTGLQAALTGSLY